MSFDVLLRRADFGNPVAQSELFTSLYPRVRAIAHHQLEQQVGNDAIGLLALFQARLMLQLARAGLAGTASAPDPEVP